MKVKEMYHRKVKTMGEIAEMKLEGILCECCGEYIGDAVGYPRRCKTCQ